MRTTSSHGRTIGGSVLCVLVLVPVLAVLSAACGERGADSRPGASATALPAGSAPTARPPSGLPVTALVMHPLHTAVLYAALPDGLYWTTDHATSWRPVAGAPPGCYIGLWVDHRAPYTLYAEYMATTINPLRLIRSNDSGYTWTDLTDEGAPQPSGYLPGLWLSDRKSGPAAVYVVPSRGGGVARSLDRGHTWVRLRGVAERRAMTLRDRVRPLPAAAQRALDAFMAPFEPNIVYWVVPAEVTDAGTVVRSTTGRPVVDPTDPSHFYLATDVGVYRSVDGGRTWRWASAGLPGSEAEEE